MPELGTAASIFGGSPGATFYGGARLNNGPYLVSLERATDFQLEIQVDPVAAAVGSSGKIYVIAMTTGPAFTLLESGEWIAFDGTVAGLGGAKSIDSYSASNAFTVNNLADLFIEQGVPINNGQVTLSVFIAYDAASLSGDVHYTSTPLSLTLVDSGLQRDALLPELPNPSSLTGAATTARFFGGASLAGSNDFSNSVFDSSADVEITLEFMPEISQFDSPGKAFVLAFASGVPYILSQSGQWNSWDGSVEGLLNNPVATYPELLSYHQIDVSSATILVDRDGVQVQDNSVAFQIFIAYQSDTVPGQLYYSG
ncbi:MAG: hypothetical protein KJN90_15120, partial [Gammaproteobacteria bacterium]|nr:hypothetical protein [Gammaproteobacteria bacterium]